ncbi:Emopamil binding protein-domain-containing protein [Pseudomassariella vexata]|uniref:Emopamil binding protein-domain-containing protein n=1 Tax=Pseudomassariella vexata TaxID=1141098 RepID=A0A1Y2EE44_9PEZI|nr:Emopamil binding protein-domain-containing protein [Pseudomassariella vexata]ORY69848.1 Emopamil binding protein-domain-containing protein [Pseudomassariella vexata]
MDVSSRPVWTWWRAGQEPDTPPIMKQAQTFSSIHPYYPLGVTIPDYASNSLPVLVLIAGLGSMLGGVLLGTSTLALRFHPKLTKSSLAVFCWFVLCGSLHVFFEGYFVLNHTSVASSQHLFAQLWKEYALSDSRYLTSDPFMLSVESITVFVWGPLCFACAVCIVTDSYLRHPLQIIMCIGHLYGVALYYATSLIETHFSGRSHSRPEFLYFWVYYVGLNLPWAIIPTILLGGSIRTIARKLKILNTIKVGLQGFQARQGPEVVKESRKAR